MQSRDIDLLDFLYQMIEDKITSYHNLAKTGVGPDARLIARMTRDEVSKLFELAKTLQKSPGVNQDTYDRVFNQLQFYANLDWIRGNAGFLVHENNVHNNTFSRAAKQLESLKELQKRHNITKKPHAKSQDETQLEHDSYEVAYYVLHTAFRLIQDPETVLEKEVEDAFGHGLKLLKTQARTDGRYHNPEVKGAIESCHDTCNTFLAASKKQGFEKSTTLLLKAEAERNQKYHLGLLRQSRLGLQGLCSKKQNPSKSTFNCSSALFYKVVTVGLVATAAVAVPALVRSLGNN